MKLKKRYILILAMTVFLFGFLGMYTAIKVVIQPGAQLLSNQSSAKTEMGGEFDSIQKAYRIISENYVEEIDEHELLEGAIQGMIETLDDPYSSYMNEDAMSQFNEQIESSFQGIGAEVSMVDGKVTVVAPIKGSPAEEVGIRPNDRILEVDGESLEGLDLNEAVAKIRGEKGTEVNILVERQGVTKPITYKVMRDDIPLETVDSRVEKVDGKETGIIEMTSFSETTATEFFDALTTLEEKGIEGLVIDVRGNPGGLLDAVEDILQAFIPKEIPYLQIEDGQGNVEKFYSSLDEKKSYPISIVVDEGSASASEILAVSLKEVGYDVVGETTFGKGTVQRTVPLSNNDADGMIKLTYFKWLSPEGNWIHEKGVKPTVKQKQPAFYYANPIQVEETLSVDQTNDQIENAQVMLQGLGYDTKRQDGYFDTNTEKAVKQFQKDQKLGVTGKIDEKTAFAIETALIDLIRTGKQDLQMEEALKKLYR